MTGPVTNQDSRSLPASATGRLGVTMDPNSPVNKPKLAEPPKNRIPNASAARTVYLRMRRGHVKRCVGFERIAGQLAGNPPFNPKAMQQSGLSDMTNVNFRDARAVKQAYALAYWSLNNDVDTLLYFELDFSGDKGQNTEWGQVLSEEFTRAIKLWPDFVKNTTLHQSELIDYGFNAWFWANEKDWRAVPIDIRDVLIPDQTENRAEALTLVGLERTFTAEKLYSHYLKALDNPDGEWNAQALAQILYQTANVPDTQKSTWPGSVEDFQKYITNQDIYWQELYNDSIHMVSLLQQEYDGKISHCMVHRNLLTDEFPFFVDRQYERFSQAFSYFCLVPGAKYIHENKGVGHEIFAPMEAITRLKCSVVDQGSRAGSLLVKSGATRGRDDRQVKFTHGGVIDVGELDVQQNQMGGNLPASLNVIQYLKSDTLANNNMAGFDSGFPDKNISKGQAQATATREGRVQKNQIAFYYDQLDPFYQEIVRKMLNSKPSDPGGDYFAMIKKRCIRRGVPEEVFAILKEDLKPDGLPSYMQVSATRSAGSGSQVADQIEMRSVMAIAPTMGERGRINANKDYVAAFRGFRYVRRYFPPEDISEEPTNQTTIASIENNQLAEGKQVIVSIDNNHAVHIPEHIRMLSDWMKLYQEQGQGNTDLLLKVNDAFAAAGPHLSKHMLYASQDPTRRGQMEQWRSQWAILANFGDMIKNNAMRAEQAMQAQQQAQGQKLDKVQADKQVGMAKVQADAQIKSDKLEADIERDRTRDQNKFLLESERLANSHRVEIINTTQKNALEAAKELNDEEPVGTPTQ